MDYAELCLCHGLSVYRIGYAAGGQWLRKNQVRGFAELSRFRGQADTVSAYSDLEAVAHPEDAEKRFGISGTGENFPINYREL